MPQKDDMLNINQLKPISKEEWKKRQEEKEFRNIGNPILNLCRYDKYIVNEDGSYTCFNDVYFFHCDFKYFPIKFKEINGHFTVSNYNDITNSLNSLINGPEIVNGTFNCNSNSLTSLQYCPKVVKNDFICFHNKLTSLKFSPEVINGNFYCNNNQLSTLKFCPKIIKENFYCDENPLTDFSYFPDHIGKNLYCNKEHYKTFQSLYKNRIKGGIVYHDLDKWINWEPI